MSHMATTGIKWQAPEFEYHEKTVSWYWLSIIIAAVIVAFSVWAKNFLFGLFIVVAEILFIVWGNREPRLIDFSIDANGIGIVGGKVHALNAFESVSIDPLENGWADIVFTFRAKLKTPFKVLFPEDRLVELRAYMKTILKEVPYEPTLIDSIEKLLRF